VKEPFLDHLNTIYEGAKKEGLPVFASCVDATTPMNASPYVTNLRTFLSGWGEKREVLVKRLAATLHQLEDFCLIPEILMIGGSFLDESVDPNDIDCVVFFSKSEIAPEEVDQWVKAQKDVGLDMRLFPLDMDPIIVLKVSAFFGGLYSKTKKSGTKERSIILVDCRND
jgi:hypothetical protein